jgi:hypothetical protein
MNAPDIDPLDLPGLSRKRGRKVVDYIADLEKLAKRSEREVSPGLKVPLEPESDEEVKQLQDRLVTSGLSPADAPTDFVQIGDMAVSRRGLRLARTGLENSVPVLAFILVDPESKSLGTLVLKVPDGGPPLMDIAMGLFWRTLNTVPIGSATLTKGSERYFAVGNCSLELFHQGHLAAECRKIEAVWRERLHHANNLEQAWRKRFGELKTRFTMAKKYANDRDLSFKLALGANALLFCPALLKMLEWLR